MELISENCQVLALAFEQFFHHINLKMTESYHNSNTSRNESRTYLECTIHNNTPYRHLKTTNTYHSFESTR